VEFLVVGNPPDRAHAGARRRVVAVAHAVYLRMYQEAERQREARERQRLAEEEAQRRRVEAEAVERHARELEAWRREEERQRAEAAARHAQQQEALRREEARREEAERQHREEERHRYEGSLEGRLEYVHQMSGRDFELFLGEVFQARGCEARVIGAAGDQGVDVLVIPPGRRPIAIQAKCYADPVSNKAVQEVLAGVLFHRCEFGIVVCSAGFTKGAVELADRMEGLVRLWDHGRLREFIRGERSVDDY
jgi:restriction system protein